MNRESTPRAQCYQIATAKLYAMTKEDLELVFKQARERRTKRSLATRVAWLLYKCEHHGMWAAEAKHNAVAFDTRTRKSLADALGKVSKRDLIWLFDLDTFETGDHKDAIVAAAIDILTTTTA